MCHKLSFDIVTDYGDDNPLLMDYFGFDPELYKVQFKSQGDASLSQKIVGMFRKVHNHRTLHPTANLKPVSEARYSCSHDNEA